MSLQSRDERAMACGLVHVVEVCLEDIICHIEGVRIEGVPAKGFATWTS